MEKFKRNDRVKYIGETWPDRHGHRGIITSYDPKAFEDDGGYCAVRFDNALTVVFCYGKSLEKI